MPTDGESAPLHEEETLAQKLFYFDSREMRAELEAFRIQYEQSHGNTDLTRRYTSLWPTEAQNWLLKNYPERYWEGLPPFVQAFVRGKMVAAHHQGMLDDMPSHFLALYLKGSMKADRGWSR